MGPLRTGLIFAALPVPALAEVCDKINPMWNETPVSFWLEPVEVFSNPLLFLLVLIVLPGAIYRHPAWQTAGVFASSFLTLFVSTPLWSSDEVRAQAMVEGCMAPPYLSTAFAAAITLYAIVRAVRRLRKQG